MSERETPRSMQVSGEIAAPPEVIYQALLDPEALVIWQVPGAMTGRIHAFDARIGGGYQKSLSYPASEWAEYGKTAAGEDRFTALLPVSLI